MGECPPGKVRNEDTKRECCWPGQVFLSSAGKCVGTPTCPKDRTPTGDDCLCGQGKNVTRDSEGHCCYEGQAWSRQRHQCTGTPTSCPDNRRADKDDCVPRWSFSVLAWNSTGSWSVRSGKTYSEARDTAVAACNGYTKENNCTPFNAWLTDEAFGCFALARADGNKLFASRRPSPADARESVMKYCGEQGGANCELVDQTVCNQAQ